MAKSSDIIKIGFDYRASLEQFVKETNGVFDGISEKAGKQRISIQLDAKNDKVIEKIKELQKLKLDGFTFEFGESGLAEQLKTFDQLEKKINEIINLSKGINNLGSGNGIGNSIVDEKSLNSIIDLFGKMENHLGEIKRVFTDVGDGGEFSPLLSTIDKINASIKELSTSVKGIGLNMNIDVGSDTEMEAKVQSKISNALQAYQRLFDHIKMSGVGGQMINTNFFEFDINQYDTMMAKLQAYKKFIENMRNEAKAQFNGKDVLYSKTDKSYWSSASAAMGQVTKAFNEMNASADTSPLENLFGKTDLTEVITQLNLIVDKLGEISATTSEFKNVFANGFNVSASVEEIEKLTNRVKELEDELSKVKVSSTSHVETNISSPIKDTFQGDAKASAESSAPAIKDEAKAMEQVAENAEKASKGKDKFAKANKKVKESADSSADSIEKETFALDEKEWDKNVKAIQEYMDANTKLNNLKAQDKGTGKKSSEIAYQTKEIERLEKVAIEARAALSSMINPHEAPIDDWNKWLEAMKQFDQATEGSAESLAKLEDSLRNMAESQFKKVNDTLSNSEKYLELLKPTEGNRSVGFEKVVQEYDKAVNSLKEFRATLDATTPLTKEQSDKFEELANDVKKARLEIDKIPKAQRGSDEDTRMKEIDKLTKYLDANTQISKKARQELEHYLDILKSGDPSVSVKELHTAWTKVTVAEREAGREGKRFFDILSDKALYGQAAQLAGYYLSLTDFIRYGKQMVDTVIEIDTALTELRKVSDATEQRLTENFKNSAKTAKDLGATVSDVISATADWARMGYNVDDAEELARISTLYKNVGDGIEIEEANNSLISTLQGFQLTADDAESVIDKFNEVANNFAIDSAGIGEALQRSAASFNAANTDLSKSIALITATNEVVQNPEVVGTLWKTMSARIRGAKTELEELGEETDEYTETTSKLRDLVKGLTGFDIMADEDTFKDIYEIILGIGQEWENLTDVEQASLGEALAGKRSANALYAVLGNLDTLEDVYKTAEKSAGSAMREQENYEKSIQYSLERLTASAQEWSAALVDSGVIKWFVDLANAIVEVSTAITPLGTLALGGGLFAGIKNVGEGKMYPFIVLNSQQQYVFFRIRKFSYCQ